MGEKQDKKRERERKRGEGKEKDPGGAVGLSVPRVKVTPRAGDG